MTIGPLSILGVILIGVHFYIRITIYYDDKYMDPSIEKYEDKLNEKVKNNEMLTWWQSFNYYFNMVFETITNWLLKIGILLIVIDILLAILQKCKG